MTDRINQEKIGERIRKIRQDLDITQHALAEELGVSPNYIAMLERGERNPSIHVFAKLAKLSGTSIDEMMYGVEVDKDSNLELYHTLSQRYQPKDVANALRFAQTFLEIETE